MSFRDLCGIILFRFAILHGDMDTDAARDPLLRFVPALSRYNSSTMAYVLLLACVISVLLERA